jgi:hypothetical protein
VAEDTQVIADLVAALQDALSALRYVRHHRGDLYGVDLQHAIDGAEAALAKADLVVGHHGRTS